MFEKFKQRFDQQKSDDAFVEAATNASARQQMIERLVKARARIFPLMIVVGVLCIITSLISVALMFAPADPSRSQSLGDGGQNLAVMLMLIIYMAIDYQIKFLKAMEASAKQSAN